jgi:hypothetical protein
LLATEREEEFCRVHTALVQELKPHSIVENMYVTDLAICVWEILRLRRAKAALINLAFRDALFEILHRFFERPSPGSPDHIEAESLSIGWFGDEACRERVSSILKDYCLDESAIEAEAIRRTASDLEAFDRMLAVQEARFNRELRAIADYRESFADRARTAANNLIEAAPVLRLEKRPVQK